ncbi:MAG TPA: phosphoribosylglycinamide formyltransferase [Gemmataceae bacterium]|nr:phosphoribosylglycinamide formyltransferase [Gemmataceae bacterium]
MNPPLRLAVLLSGGGTTLQNLLDHAADGRLGCMPARVVQVVSSNPQAFGLIRAQQAGVPAAVVERRGCPSREEFSRRLFEPIRAAGVQLVCLGGFLQLLRVPPDYQGRILNIHPALIPSFCGKGFHGRHVHEAVLEAGVKISGCTVHFVDDEYDHGPIVAQRAVPVLEDDTPETLAERVFAQECQVYPEAVRLFAEGRLRIEGRRVRVLSESEA